MDDNDISLKNKKYIFLYKTIYLIRTNLPSSEYLYIIMFFLKYLGLILFSTSLNDSDNKDNSPPSNPNNSDNLNNQDNIDNTDNRDNFGNNFNFSISSLSVQSLLSNFLVNSSNLNILNKYYEEICFIGFCFLMVYVILINYGFIYMRKKYYNKGLIISTEKKIKKINKNSKYEKKFVKMMTYIFFVIVFFHQYIIEYYLFGFLGHIFHLFGLFDSDTFNNFIIPKYSKNISEYFINLKINSIVILVINSITIIVITFLFFHFMILNSTQTLFLNIGIPFYGNTNFLILKIIIYNYNPLFGFINMFSINIKTKIILIAITINIVIILIIIFLSFYKFSYYPSKLSYMCFFIEIFSFFSIITELIIYLTNSQIDSTKFKLTKLAMILFNSLVVTFFILYKKDEHNLNIYANNLFSKTFKQLSPNDIYYYIEAYINYSKNKRKNYIKIFRIIQTHCLQCNKKDCPCNVLIPKSISYSLFTNFSKNKFEDFKKEKSIPDKNNHNNNSNKEVFNENHVNSKKVSKLDVTKYDEENNSNINKENDNNSNLSIFVNEKEIKKQKFLKFKKSTINIDEKQGKNNSHKSILNIKKTTTSKENNVLSKSVSKNLDNVNTMNDKDINLINEERKIKDEQFQMIGEQEIINRIHFLYKNKNYKLLETYIFIHLQYLMKIKQNFRLALYFIGKYSHCGIYFSFLSRYFLYEIKKYITKNITNLKNKKIMHDPYVAKYRQDNINMKKILNYLTLYSFIKTLLKIACEKIIYFYTFRSELHNSLSLQKYIKTKIYPIINSADDLKDSIMKLRLLIEKYYKEEKHSIQSIELCYLITNFFKLIEGKIPEDIIKNINPIFYFKKIYYEKIENEFHSFMMANPLIISLTKKDTFNIYYFTNTFQYKLKYNYTDLKNQDFHEKLFPGGQELAKEHSIILKQFLFFDRNDFAKDKTFIKSKEGYLVPINFVCKIFPNFSYDFFLIANIMFNDNNFSSDFFLHTNENNKKANNLNDNIINVYSFFLNYDFDFLGMTKNFYLEYDLNQNMLRELRLNFCQFFCMDENILIDKIHKERNKLIKKYPNFLHKISLKESNKAYSIFQNINIENTFKLRDVKLLESYFVPTIHIYDKIDKKKLVIKIPEIISIIDEIGLDYDWYIRLQNFKERLINNYNLKNDLEINNNIKNKKSNKKILHDNRFSSVVEQIKYESNLINIKDQFFEVIYSIKKLGSLSYYIVNLLENIDNNLEQTCNPNNNLNEIMNKIEPNNEIVKRKSKKIVKINKFLSSTIKMLKEPNEEREIEYDQKKAKTKNFMPLLSAKKKKSISLRNISEDKNKLEVQLIEEQAKTNNSKTNNIGNDIIVKETKKEEIDKENSNIKEVNDKIKIKKNIKNTNETNYIKKMKIKKKEYNEDEENSPLLTKDKFNEILKKDNKRNKILVILIYIIIFLALILNIIKFILSIIGFEASKNVLKTTIYLEMLKIDIYVQGILSITYCINEIENITDISNIHSEAKLKIKSTLDHLKILQNQINIIVNNKNCLGIINILENKLEIKGLNEDWSISKNDIDLMEELRSLTFKLDSLTNTTEICNITSNFYKFSYFTSDIYKSGNSPKANDIQKIIYYFLSNTFNSYKITFDQLLEESVTTIEKLWNIYQNNLYNIIIAIGIIVIIFIVIYIVKKCFDYSYYKLLFLYYYNIENEQLKFENQIYYLYRTINEFNSDNIDYFEYVKSNAHFLYYNEDIHKTHSSLITNNNNIIINNAHNSITNQKKDNQRKNSLLNNNIEIDKNRNIDKNSFNASMLNGSMNGSSLQFLNISNNNKIQLNNNNIQNNAFENEEKNNNKEESIDSLLNFSNKILPSSLKISLIFFLFITIIYFTCCFMNIIMLFNENTIIKYSVNLSMNILERIPRLMGLLIYACFTIIRNDEYLMEGSPYNDNQSKFLSYFKVDSLYYSEDIMNKYFKNKYFGELLRDNLRINFNFNNYLFQDNNNIFTNTKEWEELLRTSDYFCIYAAVGEVLSFQEDYTNYDFIQEVDYYATNCKQDNTGINESGIQLEITYILQEITNRYIEFITYDASNTSLEQARKNFFGSSDIRRIIVDMQLSLILYYNTITYAVNLDFDKKNSTIINQQILFSVLLFAINIIIIIGLLFSFNKNEKYKKLFGYFSKIPKMDNYNN